MILCLSPQLQASDDIPQRKAPIPHYQPAAAIFISKTHRPAQLGLYSGIYGAPSQAETVFP